MDKSEGDRTFLERLLANELLDECHCIDPVHARRNRVHDAELLHLVEQLDLHSELLLWGERRPLSRVALGEKDECDGLAVVDSESYRHCCATEHHTLLSFPIAPHFNRHLRMKMTCI